MAKPFGQTIKKLQNAINKNFDVRIVINKKQHYVEKDDRIAEILIIDKVVGKTKNGKPIYEELFSSGSDVSIVLFLRDYWYELNGWEIPTDNEQWEETKRKYRIRQENRKKKAYGK